MGAVYRARDTKLNRDVAIKVLLPEVADNPERLARFRREAQTLAALNHPNIGAIYGMEEGPAAASSGPAEASEHYTVALVIELVEGEDLSQRIARGAVPLDEALPIAKQIADALEAAHEQGIIHRDLKPANIKVRADGTVKVLDFGLAKALDLGPGKSGGPGRDDSSASPTLTSPAQMTGMGVILGTAAYMSPEQARGKVVDRRADIWAFGCVLFEMLTAARPFTGDDVADVMSRVLQRDPDLSLLPVETPAHVRALVASCLVKDPRQRLRDIGDARLALDAAFNARSTVATPIEGPLSSQRSRVGLRALSTVLAIAVIAALVLAARTWRQPTGAGLGTIRFTLPPPEGWVTMAAATATGASPASLAVSPDGSRVAFVASPVTGRSQIWVRTLDSLAAQPLPGTEGAASPFWSPDGKSLGFFADGQVKRVDLAGGTPISLCAASEFRGGTWNQDGVILFATISGGALKKVSAAGGAPSDATTLATTELGHWRPSFLPDGRHFVYFARSRSEAGAFGDIYMASRDTAERTRVITKADSANAIYAQGNLLFLRQSTLMAQPLDPRSLAPMGEPVPVVEPVQKVGSPGAGLFSASSTGVLVYQPGVTSFGDSQLTWFDRTGKALASIDKVAQYNSMALSPDESRVTFGRTDVIDAKGNADVWVYEFARGLSTRVTFEPANDGYSVWSPDGASLAWSSTRDVVLNLYRRPATGSGTDQLLLKSSEQKYVQDWSQDGHFLLYSVLSAQAGGSDLWVLPMTGADRTPRLYLRTGMVTTQAQFSPDGRYVAYTSNASGRNEVYVQPFPDASSGKWLVSRDGGSQPRWRRDGRELFYISADTLMTAVPVAAGPVFTPGSPVALFPVPVYLATTTGTVPQAIRYAVAAGGERFLVDAVLKVAPSPPMTVVLNWMASLKP